MATRVRVGDAEIIGLVDRQHTISPEWHYPDVPAEAWEPYRELLSDEVWTLLNFRAFLVRADGTHDPHRHRLGTASTRRPARQRHPPGCSRSWRRWASRTDDVELVVFTHLHADHVGWNLPGDPWAPPSRSRAAPAELRATHATWCRPTTGRTTTAIEQMHPNIREQALPLDRSACWTRSRASTR